MLKSAITTAGTAAVLALGATPTAAQDAAPIFACPTQETLEQTIDSAGDFVPDGCRAVNISVLDSDGERLCVLQLGETSGNVLQQLQDVVTEDELWVRCDLLAAEVSDGPLAGL